VVIAKSQDGLGEFAFRIGCRNAAEGSFLGEGKGYNHQDHDDRNTDFLHVAESISKN
jgi:hypothetical protein